MHSSPIALIMPIYEEEDSILDVLESLQLACPDIITLYCILDSENDSTIPVILSSQGKFSYQIEILINEKSAGPIEAIKLGIKSTKESFIVIMTADNTDDCNDILKFYNIHQTFKADYISASRYLPGGSYSGGSHIKRKLSLLANNILVNLKGSHYSDPTNGFKGVSREFISAIKIESKRGFTYGLEFLYKAKKGKFVVESFPTQWHDRTAGFSKFKIIEWLPSYTYWFLKIILSR